MLSFKIGLRSKVSLIILASLAVCFLVLGLVIHWVVQRQMRTSVEQQMFEETQLAASVVKGFIEDHLEQVEAFSQDKVLQTAIFSWDIKTIESQIESYINNQRKFQSLLVFDNRGNIRALTVPDKTIIGRNFAHRAYFQRAMQTKKVAVGDPVISASLGVPVIHIAVPIKDRQGEIQALLVAALTLNRLSERLEIERIGRSGFIVLVSGDGKILAHQDSSKIYSPVQAAIPSYRKILASSNVLFEAADPSGKVFLYSWVPINKYHWILITQHPRQIIYGPMITTGRMVLGGMVLILLVAVVTCVYFVDRHVLHPIKHIQSNLSDITLGKLPPGDLIKSGDELQALADHISKMASSLHHSYESLAKRNRELTVLNSIVAVSSQSLDVHEILETTLNKALELMDLRVGNVRLYDPERKKLVVAASRGTSSEYLQEFAEMDINNDKFYAVQAIIKGQPVLVSDIRQDDRLKNIFSPEELEQSPFCLVCVPMMVKDKIIGTMGFISRQDYHFTTEEIDIFTSIGHQLALAVEKASLLQAEREAREKEQARAQELSTLFATGRLLTTAWNLDEVLESIVDTTSALLGVNRCMLMLKDENGFLHFAYNKDIPQEFLDFGGVAWGESLAGWVASRGESLYVPQMAEDPRYKFPQLARKYGICSYMGVPLKAKDEVIGVLNIYSDQIREFSEAEIRLLSTVGDYAAIAIEKARLFKELETSEERFRGLVESTSDWIWEVDANGVYTYSSPKIKDLLGYEPAEVIGKSPFDLMPPEEGRRVAAKFGAIIQEQKSFIGLENTNLHKDGRLVILETGGVPIFDLDGRFCGYRGIDRDITERKKLEAQILQRHRELSTLNAISASLFRSLDIKRILEDAIDMILLVMNTDKAAIFVKEEQRLKLEVFRGFSPKSAQEIASLPVSECAVWQYLKDHDLRSCPDISQDPLVDSSYWERENIRAALDVRLRTKKENLGFLSVFYRQPREFGEDERHLMVSIGHQIAAALENAQLYQRTLHSYHQLQVINEINNEISMQLDLEPLLFLIARRASELIGAQASVIALYDRHTGRVYPKGWFNLPEEIKDGCLIFSEYEWKALDGERRVLCWNKEHVLPLECENSALRKVGSLMVQPLHSQEDFLGLILLMNYTDKKYFKEEDKEVLALLAGQGAVAIQNAQYIKEITELDEQRENYLSNVSHELRTPITLIRGYADALKDGVVEGIEEQQACLEIMTKECDRLTRLVEGLLLLPRLEVDDPQKTLRWSLVNINDQLKSCLQLLKPELEEKHLMVENLLPHFPQMWVDEDMIFQVILNLLNNALKFNAPGGKIILKGEIREKEIELVFTDTGPGIPAEHLEKIFDKFYMIDSGLTRKQRGMGLGLYIVRKIIELHRGRIWVESVFGAGTSFYVILPRGRA